MQSFQQLGLIEPLVRAVTDMGFESPTEIQYKAIPKLLSLDPDFLGLAQTGTGKTAAFGLPLLQHLSIEDKHTQAIILGPTRELVQQITKELSLISKYLSGVRINAVYGGTAVGPQVKHLKKNPPHILIATPGRIIDLLNRKAVNIQQIEYVVLDEADEMLDMGFQEEIDQILSFTPEEKRIWLFSATMPKSIRQIVHRYMKEPLELAVNMKQRPNENISHKFLVVNPANKLAALTRVIDFIPDFYGLIFCRTRKDTQALSDYLNKEGYPAEALHGEMNQRQRDNAMGRFRNKRISLLAATDVAARGIDVDDLTHVIHFSPPDNREYYTHRSGRTARAGKTGTSISIITPGELGRIRYLQQSLGIKIERVLAPKYADLIERRVEKWMSKINEVNIETAPLELKEQSSNLFPELSKEDLITKLLMLEFEKIKKKNVEDININERHSRKTKIESGPLSAMFLNLGKVDKMSKADLIKYITKIGRVDKNDISNLEMQKRFSTFKTSKHMAKDMIRKFKRARLKGRKIVVKYDN